VRKHRGSRGRKCEHLEPMHNRSAVPVASSQNGIVVHGMVVGGNRLKCSRMRIGQGTAGCAKDVANFEVFKSLRKFLSSQEFIDERSIGS